LHENSSVRNLVVPCGLTAGRTDRHDNFSDIIKK